MTRTDPSRPSEPSPIVVWLVAAALVIALGLVLAAAFSGDPVPAPDRPASAASGSVRGTSPDA